MSLTFEPRSASTNLEGARAVVTGAAGFIGSALTRALLAEGCNVGVLVRPTAARSTLRNLPVDIVEGDVRDRAAVREALCKARYVFHVAADYRLWSRDASKILSNNVEGTRAVMDASLEAKVEKIVFTSSVATLAPRGDGRPANEEARASETDAIGAYKRSKIISERIVEQMILNRRLPAVIVQPSTPIGPRDSKPTPTGRIVLEAASGRMPAFVRTGLNLVHVDDVAKGHILALKRGRIGQRYILGGEDVPFDRMLAAIASLVQRPPPRFEIPRKLLYPAAAISEAIAFVTDREPMLTMAGLHLSRNLMYFSSRKAAEELNYSARPYQEALRDAVSWFCSNGYLT